MSSTSESVIPAFSLFRPNQTVIILEILKCLFLDENHYKFTALSPTFVAQELMVTK